MIELYQFRPKFGVPNLSPFCLKLEAWLKMTGITYQVHYLDDPRVAPLGKLPFIKHEGVELADSDCIIEYLTGQFDTQIDAWLSSQQKALAHSCQVMIEERLYWTLVYHRWLGEGWAQLKPAVFSVLPPIVRQIVPVLVQKQLKRDLHGHGIGRHNIDRINRFAAKDLESLSVILGENSYFMGDKLSTVDATVYAILCEILQSELPTPLKAIAHNFPNLVAYQLRLGREYFPDYYSES